MLIERIRLQIKRRLFKKLLIARALQIAKQLADHPAGIHNILVVCYGNICRSPMAEAIARKVFPSTATISSAGFHETVGRTSPSNVRLGSAKLGIDLSRHRSTLLTRQLVEDADVIVIMDIRNLEDLLRKWPTAEAKTILLGAFHDPALLEIQDPYDQDLGTTETILVQIATAIQNLSNQLFKRREPSALCKKDIACTR